MYLNIVAFKDFLLERSPPPATATRTEPLPASKGREEIFKVEVRSKPTSASESTRAEGVSASEGMPGAWARAAARVEAGSSKLVELFSLLGIGQNLVGGLDLGELVLGVRVLVRVGMELLGEAIVGLLDLGLRRALADS